MSRRRFTPEGVFVRAVARTIGRWNTRRLRAAGVPQALAEPLGFLVERSTAGDDYGPVDRIEAMRDALAARAATVGSFSAPGMAPASTRPDEAAPPVRSLAAVAHISSVPALWGVFLHLCARSTGARTILELGSAAGISGSYLASSPACQRFVTVEGDPERAALAKAHITAINASAEVVVAAFDEALDRLLPTFTDGIDLVFVDGNKVAGGYIDLFEQFHRRLTRGAVVVFDDIQWTSMAADWRHLCSRAGVSFAINAGRFGLCVWNGSDARPQVFTLFGLAGRDLYALRRDAMAALGGD